MFDYKKSSYGIAHEEVIEIINKRLLYTYESQEHLRNCLASEDEINIIVEEIQNIRKYAYELANKIWDKSLSPRKARKKILKKYPYLSNKEVDIILGQALSESK